MNTNDENEMKVYHEPVGYSIFYPYRGMDDQIFKNNMPWKE